MSSSPLKAAAWMMGALTSFLAMAISGRELSSDLTTFQILFWRSLSGLLVLSLLLSVIGWQRIATRRLTFHGVRNVIHFGGQYGWFLGLSLLPLADVIAIEFTTPVWSALLAMLLLGEQLTRARMLAIGLGFLGILVILRPGVEVLSAPALIVLGAAICYAATYINTKILAKTESVIAILFYMCLIQLPIGAVPTLLNWVTPSSSMLFWILVVGCSGLSAHYCLTRALSLADATIVVPMDFMRLPLISLVGFWFYQEGIDLWLLFGAGLIAFGTLISLRAERHRNRQLEGLKEEGRP
ncbi:DMT family transporter [Coralliovum pocilloporae]|uniref:DMT family transporter n=1 Tax=Coralliovum pocilloporae TaxID=3066369 RepID=UPI003306E70B